MIERTQDEEAIPYQHGTYQGELKDGLPNGMGTYTCEQYTYKGFFSYGSMNGIGEIIEANGSRYKGGFRANQKYGQGTYTHPNGAYYVGSWEKGDRHGQGIFYLPDGSKKEGLWLEDRFVMENRLLSRICGWILVPVNCQVHDTRRFSAHQMT
ncbi:MAG: hypothetical protein KJ950_10355 [Proteobacteria bacterium]|nr:hypothetical protein [Pseudomonadota bacterium]MBU1687779.1 hypothetical protein [Pseudomonadota bacterium]